VQIVISICCAAKFGNFYARKNSEPWLQAWWKRARYVTFVYFTH